MAQLIAFDLSLAAFSAGSSMAARIAMIAITMRSSIKVKHIRLLSPGRGEAAGMKFVDLAIVKSFPSVGFSMDNIDESGKNTLKKCSFGCIFLSKRV